jgi:hypothetical protein
MDDLMMAEHDDRYENLRALMEAENHRAWEDEQYAHYATLDEEAYSEWLEDHDRSDSPASRDAYEDYLVDEQERRAGV